MKLRIATGLAAIALAVGLTGCAGGAEQPPAETTAPAPEATSPEATAPETTAPETTGALLMVAESPLGEIVVDGEGMTVYMFDNDTQGSGMSTCEGQCATNWPAVTTDSADAPSVEGVTGEVGTITGVDGSTQLTLNGWPLYYYAADTAPGDTTGQGVGDVWWVLTPAGEKIGG